MYVESMMESNMVEEKFFHFLRDLVVSDKGPYSANIDGSNVNAGMYYYRNQAQQMIKRNKSTLNVRYNHVFYVDEDLAEVIHYYYSKVSKK